MRAVFLKNAICALGHGIAVLQTPPLGEGKIRPEGEAPVFDDADMEEKSEAAPDQQGGPDSF